MEALVDPAGETIWATQKAIAALFKCRESEHGSLHTESQQRQQQGSVGIQIGHDAVSLSVV